MDNDDLRILFSEWSEKHKCVIFIRWINENYNQNNHIR